VTINDHVKSEGLRIAGQARLAPMIELSG